MNRFDSLINQIFTDNLVLESRASDEFEKIRAEKEIKDDEGNVITHDEQIKKLTEYLESAGYAKIDNDFIVHRFVIKSKMTRVMYNKLKGLSKLHLTQYTFNDFYQEELIKAFNKVFKEVYLEGKKQEDIDLLDIFEILTLLKIFIEVLDSRLQDLKKK